MCGEAVSFHGVDELFLEGGPEALDAGVVIAGAHAAHALAELGSVEAGTEGGAGELGAVAAVEDGTGP